ncbi:MAG: NAD-dependent epimerase/dehydratase family protein [Coriobacteriales bacterium]|nr:MAG: dihydroflavonol 4-reductase [Clostridiales bacterium]
MKNLYIVTGANGHLGNTIIRILLERGERVRGLILPSEEPDFPDRAEYVKGDVTEPESLRALFEGAERASVVVIHTAGIISIADEVTDALLKVNVEGTKNLLALAFENKVSKFVYVSSVHAIPERPYRVLEETDEFSEDTVHGAYAKTKAMATRAVLEYVRKGLDAVIVHPSGILGPYDSSGNHLVQLVSDYVAGKLPACVKGGYDFVDVRDVAQGTLAAAAKGKSGECFILSNRHYEIKEVLEMVKSLSGGRKLPVLPVWMAKLFLPFIRFIAKCKKERPLYTKYSLYTLSGNDKFSHEKATQELGYRPRDLYETLRDTILWLKRGKTVTA